MRKDGCLICQIIEGKIPSMKVTDIARAVSREARHEIVGIRPGEKLHEQMIGPEDALYTYAYGSYYKILPTIHDWYLDPERMNGGTRVAENFIYASDNNTEWMSAEALRAWIQQNREKVGKI